MLSGIPGVSLFPDPFSVRIKWDFPSCYLILNMNSSTKYIPAIFFKSDKLT